MPLLLTGNLGCPSAAIADRVTLGRGTVIAAESGRAQLPTPAASGSLAERLSSDHVVIFRDTRTRQTGGLREGGAWAGSAMRAAVVSAPPALGA